ncbi:MAG: 3'(2'),5'-bisphosphate nucleotidase [Planctomycetaceae bacterium]|nr:3'(2'),5'-bisphosphate nucleotidase [Planctomycetaceae bacterium]
MTVVLSHELDAALVAVRDAARICRSVQSTIAPDAMEKKDKSPVTIADFGSQAVVCRVIGDAFPHDPIIAEEDSRELLNEQNAPFLHLIHDEICKQCIETSKEQVCRWIDRGGAEEYSHRFWTLDPIDGTKGFLRKEQYAISLALIVEGQIELGVLGCPNLPLVPGQTDTAGSLFYAIRGQGAYVLPLEGDAAPMRIRVSQTSATNAARFCESVESGHSSHGASEQIAEWLGITAAPVRLDSQAKYAVVARGEADIYLRLPTKKDYFEQIWDHAGGVLVVEEAGGRVTDVTGKPLDFTHGRQLKQNRGVIVSNAKLHDAVLEAVRAVGVV